MTVNHGHPIQGGGYLIRVYTRVRDTWKVRLQVDKYYGGPELNGHCAHGKRLAFPEPLPPVHFCHGGIGFACVRCPR